MVVKGDGQTLLGRETTEILNLLHIGPFQMNNVDLRVVSKRNSRPCLLVLVFQRGMSLNSISISL